MERTARTTSPSLFSYVTFGQGAYYLLTGLWPLVSMDTFQKVTGPKRDQWLVKTVGLLVAVIGAVLAMAGFRQQTTREIPMLGVGSAAALSGIDLVYVSKRRISRWYLVDAIAELALVVLWAFVRRRGRGKPVFAEIAQGDWK